MGHSNILQGYSLNNQSEAMHFSYENCEMF